MTRLFPALSTGVPEIAAIAVDRVLEGAPSTTTIIDYQEGDHTFVGEWRADVGAWRVSYDEWEFCHVLEGACELVADDGDARRFCAGDSFVIEPGFAGVWRVLAPMRKKFVIRITK
jgi:uncharacterized cupin superfamily protein